MDRLAGEGDHTVADEMREVHVKGLHRVEVRDKKGMVSEAVLELRYRRIKVLAPVAKRKMYPPLMLTVLHATERNLPKGREPINWKLVTDLPIRSRDPQMKPGRRKEPVRELADRFEEPAARAYIVKLMRARKTR